MLKGFVPLQPGEEAAAADGSGSGSGAGEGVDKGSQRLNALDAQIAALVEVIENVGESSSDDGDDDNDNDNDDVYGVGASAGAAGAAEAAPKEGHRDIVEPSLGGAAEHGEHGEMSVTEAQRTAAVRVPAFIPATEVAQILGVYESVRGKCGLATQKHGEASSNWNTTFLQTDGHFAAGLPELRQKVLDVAVAVDAQQGQ